ncbi:MAG: GtrA family protein, partial [Lachnospiraceae bacterium]|nr:GtrA family protein [Lachnospiraceae bacterium]
ILATVCAFICSTSVNWILGRITTFKEKKYEKKGREAFLVFLVSGIGLLFNLFLMFIFVDKLHLYGLFSKVMATGIVFIWNFLSRKFMIYKE